MLCIEHPSLSLSLYVSLTHTNPERSHEIWVPHRRGLVTVNSAGVTSVLKSTCILPTGPLLPNLLPIEKSWLGKTWARGRDGRRERGREGGGERDGERGEM